MNPTINMCKIDAYPDTYFACVYGHEEHTDPACAKSWTEFITLLKIVLSCGSQSYKQRWLCQQWKPK